MDLSGLPDDTLDPGLDLGGLPDTNAKALREQYRVTTSTPDDAAKVIDIARRSGLPKPVVERNRKEAERKAFEPDWTALEVSAPITARELASSAKLFELANDDTENLRQIERTMYRRSAGLIGGPAFNRAQGDLRASVTPEASFSSIAYGLADAFNQGAERARQGVRMQFADAYGLGGMGKDALLKRDRAQFAQDLSTPYFETETARGLYAGGQSTLQNLPGIAASVITRNPAPALSAAGLQTELDAYGKYRSRGASGGEAFLGAAGEGTVEVLTEMIPLHTMLGAFGQPGKTFAKEFVKSQVQEQFGEQAATLLQDAIDTAIANPTKTWGDYLKERPDAAYQTFLATLVQSGVMTAGHVALAKMAGPQAQADAATRDAEALAQLAQLSAASKLRARDPQSFKEFVAAANEEGEVQDLYLDARTLQQAGIDVQALAQASPAVATQLEEAIATGGDLVVPVAEYAAQIAGTDLDARLTPHLRTAEDALSLNEAQTFYQGQAEAFQQAAAQVMQEKAADDTFVTSAKAVETKLFEELKNAGRFTDDVSTAYSTLLRDFYVATASRLGITPEEMFSRYPLRVAAERIAGDARRMDQGVETPAFRAWFGDSKVVDAKGSPLVVYHGTKADFTEFRTEGNDRQGFMLDAAFFAETPTAAKEHTSGDKMVKAYVSLKNPRIATMEDDSDAVNAWRNPMSEQSEIEAARATGNDGVIFVNDTTGERYFAAFRPEQIKSINNSGEFNPNDPNILKQNPLQRFAQSVLTALGLQQPEAQPAPQPEAPAGAALDMGQFFQEGKPDLVVTHNLTARNLLHALKMGGIPVPSLAITKAEHPLTGFGEITLIGSKEMADPKGYAGTKVFGADIYSPRYPSVEYQFTPNMRKLAEARLKDGLAATKSSIDWEEISRRGVDSLRTEPALRWHFLKERGVEPTITRVEPKPLPAALQPFAADKRFGFDLEKDPAFIEAAYKAFEDALISANGESYRPYAEQEVADLKAKAEDRGVSYLIRDYARQVETFFRDSQSAGTIDTAATNRAIETQIYELGLTESLELYADEFLRSINPNERIFQGYTYNGNRRYVPHTLENVVKILKKELRGGEGFNYGVASIRSKFTPQFKSIKQIREAKGRLMDKEAFEKVKEEINTEFFALVERLAGSHSVGRENTLRFADTVTSMAYDAATMGIPRALKENGFGEVSIEAQQDIAEFLGKLRSLPTEYFEAKILREVDLAEFSGAVVPEGVDPSVVQALNSRGVKDIRYYKPNDEADRRAKIGEFESLFFQGNRAEIAFGRDITQTPSVITLFNNADLSSFLHEMGHFELEVLAHIASQPNAPAEIVADFNTALKWFGVVDLATWQAMSLEEKRPYHEMFARGFESYLFEGKAPSQELTGLFARFRAWLINVYKSVKALNVEISDDIRRVFDRLVATDEAIRQAEAARAYTPLFPDDPEVQAAAQAATQTAVEDLQKRSLRDMQWLTNARGRLLKQMQRDAKEKRKAVEAEVRAEVRAMPIYAARRFLAYGELADADLNNAQRKVVDQTAGRPTKLELAALKEMYGEGTAAPWRYLPTGKNGLAGTEGLPPDLVAEMFGFTSGDQLVRELLAAEPEAELIEGLTDQRVLERYGDLAHPDTLARAVDEAIHNEMRLKVLATELKAATKAQTPVRAILQAAKQFAEMTLARKKVKDIKPRHYAAAETRAGKAAMQAFGRGDTATLANEKRNQVLQGYLTKLSYEALDEIDKGVRYLRKFDGGGARKNIDADYLDQIDQLVERFDLRASVSNRGAAKRTNLLAWVEAQREEGFEPDIPPDLLTEALRKPYKELTLEELRGLVDTVKQIEHLGRLKRKLLTSKDEREFAAIRDEIAASIEANAKGTRDLRTRNTTGAMLADAGNRFLAMHRKMASVAREMDGFADGGPMWEYLIRSMNTAGDRETAMRAEATAKLYDLVKPLTAGGKMGGRGIYFSSLGMSLNREERIAIALNMGNAGNMQRLLDGEGWTPERVQPVLDTITADEAEFVQAVWDFFESYRPEIGAKERRIYGKEPAWVEPVPLTLGGKSLRGGYYPVKYDPARSGRAEQHAEAEAARAQMRGAYTSATTRRSFTKTRADAVTGRPLLYSFAGIYQGANEVIHDLAWHEWLIDSNRLLRSLDGPIRLHYGPEAVSLFKSAIQDIAAGDVPAQNVFERGLNHARVGATVAGLGWNVTTSLLQPLGLTQSMARIGPGWVAKGLGQWIKAPGATIEEITGKSPFMRDRARTMQREINEIQNQVRGSHLDPVRSTFFLLIQKMQMVADVPTWLGAYEKAIAAGEAEDRAIALADQAVIDSQGGGQMKDLAQIQRGSPALKLFTNFYSFFNVAYNLGVEKTKEKITQPKLYPSLALDYLLLYSVPAVLSALLKEALTGGLDDDEELVKKLIAEQISYLLGLMVGVREMTAAAQKVLGVEQFKTSYGGTAGVRLFQEIDKLGQQIGQGEIDKALLKAINNVGGILFHYPSGQINKTADGVAALIEGRTENPAAVVAGAPKH